MSIPRLVESWVEEALDEFTAQRVPCDKIIRDTCHGIISLSPIEVTILDSPILQRLRQIHQMECAFFVYPGARHSRFEHSLGALATVTQYCDALQDVKGGKANDDLRLALRLAGLLHDVGHGPFSHLSESIYEKMAAVQSELKQTPFRPGKNERRKRNSASEMFAYYIVTSSSLKDFVYDNFSKFNYDGPSPDLDEIATFIIGKPKDPLVNQFKADMINGPFDADKLDYLVRDAHYTGLPLAIDADLITRAARIHQGRLAFEYKAVHLLEQLVFAKLQMFSTVYHQQKNRAAHCTMKSILELLHDNPRDSGFVTLRKATDFLRWNDLDILNLDRVAKNAVKRAVTSFRERKIMKRALVVSYSTLVPDDASRASLVSLAEQANEDQVDVIHSLRRAIVESAFSEPDDYMASVWADFPKPPTLDEPAGALLMSRGVFAGTLEPLLPDGLEEKYVASKWKGHIFGPADVELRNKIAKAAKSVLESEYPDLKLSESSWKEAGTVV